MKSHRDAGTTMNGFYAEAVAWAMYEGRGGVARLNRKRYSFYPYEKSTSALQSSVILPAWASGGGCSGGLSFKSRYSKV